MRGKVGSASLEWPMNEQELFVCVNCFDDPGLVGFVENNAVTSNCSFCTSQSKKPIAAPVEDVSAYFIECLFREYDLAANALGWIGSEGGYIGQYWVAVDLAFDELALEFPQNNQESLLPHLFGEYYDQELCEQDPYGPNDSEWARFSWGRFCHTVMHERRYFFLGQDGDSNEPRVISPGEVLSTIFDYAQAMGLLRKFPGGSQLVRARYEGDGLPLETELDLGPPPAKNATQPNRMSPAGIPMFYACEDEATALKETARDPGKFAVGWFETLRPITILDLTNIPPIPSLFEYISDSTEIPPRRALTFLQHISKEMSRPIDRDTKMHINYVPTQVVTEFIRDQLTWDDTPIHGIGYQSAVHPGHVSYVLFANRGNMVLRLDKPLGYDPWLRLVKVKHRMVRGVRHPHWVGDFWHLKVKPLCDRIMSGSLSAI